MQSTIQWVCASDVEHNIFTCSFMCLHVTGDFTIYKYENMCTNTAINTWAFLHEYTGNFHLSNTIKVHAEVKYFSKWRTFKPLIIKVSSLAIKFFFSISMHEHYFFWLSSTILYTQKCSFEHKENRKWNPCWGIYTRKLII